MQQNLSLTRNNQRLKERITNHKDTMDTMNEQNQCLKFQLELSIAENEINTTAIRRESD